MHFGLEIKIIQHFYEEIYSFKYEDVSRYLFWFSHPQKTEIKRLGRHAFFWQEEIYLIYTFVIKYNLGYNEISMSGSCPCTKTMACKEVF